MFGREYFERVLNEQVAAFGQSVTVKVGLTGRGEPLEVWTVFAAHDGYVVLEVHPARQRVGWTEALPPEERWIFDQVAAPYESIVWTELTTDIPADAKTPIGFQPPR